MVEDVPVLAGVCGTDPFRLMRHFLRDVDAAGFSGVQNFPTVGLFDGKIRQNLEETGMGFGLEVDMIRIAYEMGLLTTPYCFNPDEAAAMANAGADILIPHMGLTTKGTIGAVDRPDPGGIGPARPGNARRGQTDQAGHPGPVPRRPHRRTGRRSIHPGSHRRDRRLLRGQQHGTPTRRTRHRQPGAGVHQPDVQVAVMKTDKQLLRIFEAEPQWVFQLSRLPSPGPCTLRSVVVKVLERRADAVLVPDASSPPLTVLECQFQKDASIYTRTVAEMLAVQEANHMRPVQGLIFFGYNDLDPRTEPWTRVVRTFVLPDLLADFEREHPGHPLVAVFQPLLVESEVCWSVRQPTITERSRTAN